MGSGYGFIMIPIYAVSIRRVTVNGIGNIFFFPHMEAGFIGKPGREEDLLSVSDNITAFVTIQVTTSWGVGPCEAKDLHPMLSCLQ